LDKISVIVNFTQKFSQFRFFKLNPEIRCQYFGFLAGLSDEEMRLSPWLIQHASGVVLGVTQIVNGLENPVSPYILFLYQGTRSPLPPFNGGSSG
jgi:hypothetical protein